MTLSFKTKSFKNFKKLIGQNNHFLITILVGLDGVAEGKVKKNDDFNTTWNPQNLESSVVRSRHFAISATMAWLVDCIDTYFSVAYKKPKLIQSEKIEEDFTRADKSVFSKFQVFKSNYSLPEPETLLIELVIAWRNRLIHYLAQNNIDKAVREKLRGYMQHFKDNYQGLDINEVIDHFDKNDVPKFKEVTAFIRASIVFIEALDKELVTNLNFERYIDEIVTSYVLENKDKRLNNIWSKDCQTKSRVIRNIVSSYGIEVNEEKYNKYIIKFFDMSFKEALNFFEESKS